jgi:tetratricopeptide (TPR) repeat protein
MDEPLSITLPETKKSAARFSFSEEPDPMPPTLSAMASAPNVKAAYRALLDILRSSQNRDDLQIYFHAAVYFLSKRSAEGLGCALKAISNLAEAQLDNAAPIRLAAALCLQAGLSRETADLFEQALRLRPEEPQSYRDLAVAVNELGPETKNYERALQLLNSVVDKEWDKRFEQIEVVALMDLNSIYRRLEATGLAAFVSHNVFADFVKVALDTDVRVVLTWTADGADVNLQVTEPSGEVCTPFHNQTASGGMQSRDMPTGYGPVEYLVRVAKPGKYRIAAMLFAPPANGQTVFATVRVYTNYGRQDQHVQAITKVLPKEPRSIVQFGVLAVRP